MSTPAPPPVGRLASAALAVGALALVCGRLAARTPVFLALLVVLSATLAHSAGLARRLLMHEAFADARGGLVSVDAARYPAADGAALAALQDQYRAVHLFLCTLGPSDRDGLLASLEGVVRGK